MSEAPSHEQLHRHRHSIAQIENTEYGMASQDLRARPRSCRAGSVIMSTNNDRAIVNIYGNTQPNEFLMTDMTINSFQKSEGNRSRQAASMPTAPPPVPKRNYIPPMNQTQAETSYQKPVLPPSVPPRLPPGSIPAKSASQISPVSPVPVTRSHAIRAQASLDSVKQFQNSVPVNTKNNNGLNATSTKNNTVQAYGNKQQLPVAPASNAQKPNTPPSTELKQAVGECSADTDAGGSANATYTRASSMDKGKGSSHSKGKLPPPPAGPPPSVPNKCYGFASTSSASQTAIGNVPPPLSHVSSVGSSGHKGSLRQDSSVSSDSFSQTSSPSYTTKTMETPLLPHHAVSSRLCNGKIGAKLVSSTFTKNQGERAEQKDTNGNAALTKSVSTPASLQTIVRFHNGSNMSLHHRIIRDMRRPSSHYVSRIRLRFRLAQVVVNALALLAIGGGLAAYFKAYPTAVKIINNNVTSAPMTPVAIGLNPAPGICLPVIVNFCQHHKVPYNFTVFPNYMGHFGQRDAQQELEVYDAVVDVRCYELAALFLCSVFVPKCGPAGQVVRPCRSLCYETKRRCGFFLDVFGLTLPEYLECSLFPESPNPEVCVGHHEFKEAQQRAQKPVCPTGFQCDVRRCIPKDWQCDGHVDCKDQSDELNCVQCEKGMIHCGAERCMAQEHMCDGKVDCPWAQDERNCLRLSERNGDEGRGRLEVYRPEHQKWVPACVAHWDQRSSPNAICNLLGYKNSNSSRLMRASDSNISPGVNEAAVKWRMHPNKRTKKNLLKEFGSCSGNSYPTVDLTCVNYVCGKTRKSYAERASARIVGGVPSKPGDWPFLAALLGGPEEVFYCAGVLIADQWVLTASHCVGNHSDVSGWTIQLGITRRHAHSYYGQKMKVKRVVPHPLYNLGVAHDNDVALFQLASPVTFHEHLLPVCLPPANKELLPGTVCTVIGWGKKEDKDMSEYEPAVNEVEVPVLNRDLCNSWLENRDLNVTEGMICAGYKEGGKDACQGDSGGPLLCRDDNDSDRWFVGGIVSWGIKCAHPHLPGVYAYVPKYIPWIKRQLELYSD